MIVSSLGEQAARPRGSLLTATADAVILTRTGDGGGVDLIRLRPGANAPFATLDLPQASFIAAGTRPGVFHVLASSAGGGELLTLTAGASGLRIVDRASTGGTDPCHLALLDDRTLAVANYTSGSVAIFDVDDQGIPRRSQLLSMTGSGPDPDRQTSAHPHFIATDLPGAADPSVVAVVIDLGADRLRALRRSGEAWLIDDLIELHPGAGPRHAAASGERLVVVDELSGEITALSLTSPHSRCTISSSGRNGDGPVYPGDIVALPGAIAVANRTRDTVAVVSVSDGGALSRQSEWPTGAWPHQLGWDGEWIVVLELHGGRIVRLDPRDGTQEVVLEGLKLPSCAVDLDLSI